MLEFLKCIPQSFHSRSFYVNLVRRGKGIGAAFILLQVFLALAPFIALLPHLPEAQEHIDAVLGRFPEMTIKGQKLSIDQPSPYVVPVTEIPKSPTIIFDTSAQDMNVAEIDNQLKTKNALVLVTSDFAAVRNSNKTELYYFRDYNKDGSTVVVDHAEWIDFGHKLLTWGIPLTIVFAFFGMVIWQFIVTFIEAVITLALAMFGSAGLDISAAMRLSAAAAIPLSIMKLLFALTVHKDLPFVASAPLWLAYAIFALHSVNNAEKGGKNI